jgi:hypothetical protein
VGVQMLAPRLAEVRAVEERYPGTERMGSDE